jgi:hypothetical protein
MKVNGPGGTTPIGQSAGRAKSSGEGFSLSDAEASTGAARTAPLADSAPVSSLDALIALQEYPTGTEKRRRAVKRASGLLDKLDQVKLAMLEGGSGAEALAALAAAVKEAREDTADPRLEAVLNEIETRAAVELAKQEAAARGV